MSYVRASCRCDSGCASGLTLYPELIEPGPAPMFSDRPGLTVRFMTATIAPSPAYFPPHHPTSYRRMGATALVAGLSILGGWSVTRIGGAPASTVAPTVTQTVPAVTHPGPPASIEVLSQIQLQNAARMARTAPMGRTR